MQLSHTEAQALIVSLDDRMPIAGYYNQNYVIAHAGERYVVRVPIPGAAAMDLRLIPETVVLSLLEASQLSAPRLQYVAPDGHFAVHSYIAGRCLHDMYPGRTLLPGWVAPQIATLLGRIHVLDPAPLRSFCTSLPQSPESVAFFLRLVEHVRGLYARLQPQYAALYAQLGVPIDPLAAVLPGAQQLQPRSFVVCHCDVHRKNLILSPDDQLLVLLDWELTLVADPAYELAVHLHKMRYAPDQEALLLQGYLDASGSTEGVGLWRQQVDVYLRLERVKSALIDVVRAVADVRQPGLDDSARRAIMRHYLPKLQQAWAVWDVQADPRLADPARLLELLR